MDKLSSKLDKFYAEFYCLKDTSKTRKDQLSPDLNTSLDYYFDEIEREEKNIEQEVQED